MWRSTRGFLAVFLGNFRINEHNQRYKQIIYVYLIINYICLFILLWLEWVLCNLGWQKFVQLFRNETLVVVRNRVTLETCCRYQMMCLLSSHERWKNVLSRWQLSFFGYHALLADFSLLLSVGCLFVCT